MLLTAEERKMLKQIKRIEKAIGVHWEPKEEQLPATLAVIKKQKKAA